MNPIVTRSLTFPRTKGVAIVSTTKPAPWWQTYLCLSCKRPVKDSSVWTCDSCKADYVEGIHRRREADRRLVAA